MGSRFTSLELRAAPRAHPQPFNLQAAAECVTLAALGTCGVSSNSQLLPASGNATLPSTGRRRQAAVLRWLDNGALPPTRGSR